MTLTVQQDLQKAIAAAQQALGSYAMFAQATQDQAAKQMFEDMKKDMERHVGMMQARVGYLNANNQLNQQQQQQQQQQQH